MSELASWSKKNAKFFKLEDGESETVTYEGYTIIKSSFDPEKEVVRYTLKTVHGIKTWDSSSGRIANFFDQVKPGQKVTITRIGVGKDTTYKVSLEKS